jgi:hypothetical protein
MDQDGNKNKENTGGNDKQQWSFKEQLTQLMDKQSNVRKR